MTVDSQISEREKEILCLVATGATNQQIAHQLNISVNTVKVHLRNIFGKIGVASRTEATVYAIRQGLVSIDDHPELAQSLEPIAESSASLTTQAVEETANEVTAPEYLTPLGDTRADIENVAETTVEERQRNTPFFSPRRLGLVVIAALAIIAAIVVSVFVYSAGQHGETAPPSVSSPLPAVDQSRWQVRAPMLQPRADFAVAAYAAEGKIYVIGGADVNGASSIVERYDPNNDLWVQLNDKPTAVSYVQSVIVRGRIYVPGGEDSAGNATDVFEAYDPRTKQWEKLPSLPEPRSRYALAAFEGLLYLFGGWGDSGYCDDVFIYDPEDRRWQSGQPLPTPRRDAGAGVVEGRIFVIGGENKDGPVQANERYDPTVESGGRWESAVPYPQPITSPAVVGLVNSVFVFDPERRTVAVYVPSTDAWSDPEPMMAVSVSSRAAALGASVFVFGTQDADPSGSLSEYKALFNTYLPGITRGK